MMVILPRYSASDVIGHKLKHNRPADSGKIFLAFQGLLEREYRLITGLLCLNDRNRREKHHLICQISAEPGFRSSEA